MRSHYKQNYGPDLRTFERGDQEWKGGGFGGCYSCYEGTGKKGNHLGKDCGFVKFLRAG